MSIVTADSRALDGEGSRNLLAHHPVFYRFRTWQGTAPQGFTANFLGVLTDASFCRGWYPENGFPLFQEDYFEWIDLLEAVTASTDRFVMLELGAGWGRWTANAAAALRQYNPLPYHFIAVEAEPTHFRWMQQHLRTNGVNAERVQLIKAAVAATDGEVGFHISNNPYGGPADWYGQALGGSDQVKAVSLNTLLGPLHEVDLVDLDVQGAELEILSSAAAELDAKVKRIHIGTHSREIEAGLRKLFSGLSWISNADYPCLSVNPTDYGMVSFVDGVQSWSNPKFRCGSQHFVLRANHLLDSVGFALDIDPACRQTASLLTDGIIYPHSSELLAHLVRKGDTCIEAGYSNGYFACLLALLIGDQGALYVVNQDSAHLDLMRNNLELNALAKCARLVSDATELPLLLRETENIRALRLECDQEGLSNVVFAAIRPLLAGKSIDLVLLTAPGAEAQTRLRKIGDDLSFLGYRLAERPHADAQETTADLRLAGESVFVRPGLKPEVPYFSLLGSLRFGEQHRRDLAYRNSFLEAAMGKTQCTDERVGHPSAPMQRGQETTHGDTGTTNNHDGSKHSQHFSPGRALWNQRVNLSGWVERILHLHAAVGSPEALSLYQWAQLTAAVLEYQPDLILELGREAGNSTACFLEAVRHLETPCRLLSVCPSITWERTTADRLRQSLPASWFQAGEILVQDILKFDFAVLRKCQRCLVFWDAPGFEVAECVLGSVMPMLADREHLVFMHDISDVRFVEANRHYAGLGLWKGERTPDSALWLGWMFSKVAQSVSILDFTSRNQIQLHSADESIHADLTALQRRELGELLGTELASPQAHWCWFTLNGMETDPTFPQLAASAAATMPTGAGAPSTEMEASLAWRLIQHFRSAKEFLVPEGSLLRKGYDLGMKPFRAKRNRLQ